MTQTYCVHKETLISALDAVMHNTQYRHQKKFASLQGLYCCIGFGDYSGL